MCSAVHGVGGQKFAEGAGGRGEFGRFAGDRRSPRDLVRLGYSGAKGVRPYLSAMSFPATP
ncbi:MAG: hypothetical protein JWN03_3627 [Nocardia sp.]|nr:hypothetical protein [Nocardia sp.]